MYSIKKKKLIFGSFGATLAILCWIVFFATYASEHLHNSHKSIPAFSVNAIDNSTSEIIFSPSCDTDSSYTNIYSMLDSFDADISLVSSHYENNYSDYYFYSPKLKNELGIEPISTGFNIHVAITKNNHIYLGTPCISYDF